jgi:UDP-3-O-[3-hydroxymyristoyl] glucosamine N-acyltransferase
MKKVDFDHFKKLLGPAYKVRGIDFFPFSSVKSAFESDPDSLTWINPLRKDRQEILKNTISKVIVCDSELVIEPYLTEKCFLIVQNPKAVFTRILREFCTEALKHKPGIHSTAIVHPEAKIHPSVHIGAYTIIGNCTIGEGSVILSSTKIHDKVEIGSNVQINEFCNIGGDGFGHIWNEENKLEKMPHLGKVIIEDDVEILQFVNIDKGTLTLTHIKKGVVLDHYVHVGHNATVGENSLIAARTVFCGGSSVGKNCFIGVQTIIIDAIAVGDNITIGAGSIVSKPISNPGKYAGVPAMPVEELIRRNSKIRELYNKNEK